MTDAECVRRRLQQLRDDLREVEEEITRIEEEAHSPRASERARKRWGLSGVVAVASGF